MKRKPQTVFSDSSSMEELEEENTSRSEGSLSDVVINQKSDHAMKVVKLVPPFSGQKESWKVWLAHFEVIVEDQNWSDKQKLRVLLP